MGEVPLVEPTPLKSSWNAFSTQVPLTSVLLLISR